jgi:hypothetical protein
MMDVDATWDGTGSLDDHRQKEFATLQQAGFGGPKPKPKPAAFTEPEAIATEDHGDVDE